MDILNIPQIFQENFSKNLLFALKTDMLKARNFWIGQEYL